MSVSCFCSSVFQIDNLWGLGCGIEAAHYAIEQNQIPLTRPGLLLKVCVIVWGQLFLLCLSNLKPSFSLATFSALLASGHFLGGISAVDTSSSNRQRVICSHGRWWCDRHIFHALIFPRGSHWGLAGRWCIRGRRKGRVFLLSLCHRELLRSIQLPAASAGLSHPAVHLTATAKVMSPSLSFQVETGVSSV